MIELFFAICIVAMCHFIYESILAPSFRLRLRFKLFALRDELRDLKIERNGSLDNKHFDFLQDSINSLIFVLFRVDMSLVISAQNSYQNDKEFRRNADERAKILDDCQIAVASEIRRKSLWVLLLAIIVNSGMLVILTLPVILLVHGLSETKKRLRKFASLSEQDMRRIAPQDSLTASLT
jgi:hypothetical protein